MFLPELFQHHCFFLIYFTYYEGHKRNIDLIRWWWWMLWWWIIIIIVLWDVQCIPTWCLSELVCLCVSSSWRWWSQAVGSTSHSWTWWTTPSGLSWSRLPCWQTTRTAATHTCARLRCTHLWRRAPSANSLDAPLSISWCTAPSGDRILQLITDVISSLWLVH